LLVEGDSEAALRRGLRGLVVRIARAVNRILGRRGAVWAERHHARALTTPRAVRHALLYVLMNFRKHGPGHGLDPCSSAIWFDGWSTPPRGEILQRSVVAPARTWLAAVGWRRYGLIGLSARPA
jgi:hypothetical protein